MLLIKSKIFAQFPELVFGFSTKIGLNRKPPFNFNISVSVGDNTDLVLENRNEFFKSLGLDYKTAAYQKQIHGSIIKEVTSCGQQGESDAIITGKKGIALAVTSADCPAIFIFDKNKKVIAAVHSGWRGTEQKILNKTIEALIQKYNSLPEDLFAFIAPAISQKNYEVGEEVAKQFEEKYIKASGEKFLLDLKSANYDMLINKGMPAEQVEVSELCSYECSQFLHSYRREGAESGRAWGVICLC